MATPMTLLLASNIPATATKIGAAVACNVSPFNGFMANRNALAVMNLAPTGVAVVKLQGCGRKTDGTTPASGDAGWNDIATFTSSVGLATPVNDTFTTAATGGSLAQSTTFYYRVSAINQFGESLASTETSLATASGTATNVITVKWLVTPGATGYNIYGRTTGAELLIGTVSGNGTLSFVDTGSVTPAGALPTVNLSATPTTQEVVLQDWVRYNITTLGTGVMSMFLRGIQ